MKPFDVHPPLRISLIIGLVATRFFAGIGARLVFTALTHLWE